MPSGHFPAALEARHSQCSKKARNYYRTSDSAAGMRKAGAGTGAGVPWQPRQHGSSRLLLAICLLSLMVANIGPSTQTPAEVFTNTFHVRFVRDVQPDHVHQIAKRHGFVNLGPVSYFPLARFLCIKLAVILN